MGWRSGRRQSSHRNSLGSSPWVCSSHTADTNQLPVTRTTSFSMTSHGSINQMRIYVAHVLVLGLLGRVVRLLAQPRLLAVALLWHSTAHTPSQVRTPLTQVEHATPCFLLTGPFAPPCTSTGPFPSLFNAPCGLALAGCVLPSAGRSPSISPRCRKLDCPSASLSCSSSPASCASRTTHTKR